MLPVTRSAALALGHYLRWRRRTLRSLGRLEGESALFLNDQGRRISVRSIGNLTRKLGKKAGVVQRVTPKLIRNSFATHFLDRGGDLRVLQDLLGHSQATSTAVYSQTAVLHLRKVYDRMHPRA